MYSRCCLLLELASSKFGMHATGRLCLMYSTDAWSTVGMETKVCEFYRMIECAQRGPAER